MKKIFTVFTITILSTLLITSSAYGIDPDTYKENKTSDVHSTESSNKIVYLTFDDGPSNTVTKEILQVLKDENVKATFFVVGYKVSGREEILNQIKDEGHSIGLHTFSHRYDEVYRSNASFIKEMDDTREEVKKATGITSNLIRFPAGSKPHLTHKLLGELHEKNYKIYDWNTCIPDGINYRIQPNVLYDEAVKTGKCWSTIFFLMHCDETNENTVKALPKIIEYYKNRGYQFKIIDNSTPEYYFRIKN